MRYSRCQCGLTLMAMSVVQEFTPTTIYTTTSCAIVTLQTLLTTSMRYETTTGEVISEYYRVEIIPAGHGD